jgi:hypothetical protein
MHTIKIEVEDSIYSHIMFLLNNLNKKELKIIEDKKISSIKTNERDDIEIFSNHSANIIEEWKDSDEDQIWI